MNYLITGGAGFLGINLVRYLLARGHAVRTYDIAPFDYPEADQIDILQGDIRHRNLHEAAFKDIDIVVHCAAALPLCPKEEIFSTDVDGTRIYHAGDTALIKDMELLESHVDVALLPIGDNFTMGPEDAARAVEMIKPRVVIPIHFDTWPLIAQDSDNFRALVEPRAEVVVLAAGEAWEF